MPPVRRNRSATDDPTSRRLSRSLFPTDEPVRPRSQLIGREDDLNALVGQLSAGVHRILAAPRRTGKSSLCHAALEVLEARGCYTIDVSLFRLASATALAEAIASEALANRAAVRKLMESIRATPGRVLRGASLTLSVKLAGELGPAVELALNPDRAVRDPHDAIISALELAQQIADADDRQMILCIDELQKIAEPKEPYGPSETLLQRLRETLHSSSRITCLLSGSIEHLMRDLFTSRQRALYNFGGFHDLNPITTDEWRVGLAARFAQDNTTITPDAVDLIVERGEGHPRSTMLIAQQTHVVTVAANALIVDLDAARTGFEEALAADRARHVDLFDTARALGSEEAGILTRLAASRAAYGKSEAKSVSRALHRLARRGIVHNPDPRRWLIDDPLFAHFLRREIDPH